MFERFTHTARRTVVLAQEEARKLNHNYVGTEHLLLALTSDQELAGQALADLGVTHDEARGHVIEIIGTGMTIQDGHITFTPRAKTVLLNALRIALDFGDNHIGSEHLLLSLLIDDKSVAGLTIVRCGADRVAIGRHLADLMTAAPKPAPEPVHGFALSA